MASIGTPNNLEILIHTYVSGVRHPRITAPAVQEGHALLVDHGLITPSTAEIGCYNITGKGETYLKHLLGVPFPVSQWVIPQEES